MEREPRKNLLVYSPDPRRTGPTVMKILIAIEPRSYREVIGLAIEELRPHLCVEVVDPGTLQSELSSLRPDVVFCGGSKTASQCAEIGAKAWVEFRPYEATQARVCLGGKLSEIKDVDLNDILSIVDATERIVEAPLTPNCGIAARRQRRSTPL